MVDDSNADDDSFLREAVDHSDPPFDIGDMVTPDPDFLAEDDPAGDRRGRVLELRPVDRGWKVLVEWTADDRQWEPANRLTLG